MQNTFGLLVVSSDLLVVVGGALKRTRSSFAGQKIERHTELVDRIGTQLVLPTAPEAFV